MNIDRAEQRENTRKIFTQCVADDGLTKLDKVEIKKAMLFALCEMDRMEEIEDIVRW